MPSAPSFLEGPEKVWPYRLAAFVLILGAALFRLFLLMTIDDPYTRCWGCALVFVYRALFRTSPRSWLWAGLCVALGILAKHTMVLFVPMVGLFLLATPTVRGYLRRPGFWVMLLVG